MRLSVVPQERRFYGLFKRQGELVAESLAQLRNGLLEGRAGIRGFAISNTSATTSPTRSTT